MACKCGNTASADHHLFSFLSLWRGNDVASAARVQLRMGCQGASDILCSCTWRAAYPCRALQACQCGKYKEKSSGVIRLMSPQQGLAELGYSDCFGWQDFCRTEHVKLSLKQPCCCALQVAEVKSARDELFAEVSALEQQSQALQAEIDARDAKCAALEKAQTETANQMEVMLGRLRELEGEQQQLEARQLMMQEENLELSTEV